MGHDDRVTDRMGITSFADLHNADGFLAKYLLACQYFDELLGGIVILYSASFLVGRVLECDAIFIQH